jgi:hypothetical protein
MPSPFEELMAQRDRLKQELASLTDMRSGFLMGRYRKCGKPTCHCARPGAQGHGPSWSLTRVVKGKTVTRVIPSGEEVSRAKEQIQEYHRFRRLTKELAELSDRICDLRLWEEGGEVKKKRSRQRPTGRRHR